MKAERPHLGVVSVFSGVAGLDLAFSESGSEKTRKMRVMLRILRPTVFAAALAYRFTTFNETDEWLST